MPYRLSPGHISRKIWPSTMPIVAVVIVIVAFVTAGQTTAILLRFSVTCSEWLPPLPLSPQKYPSFSQNTGVVCNYLQKCCALLRWWCAMTFRRFWPRVLTEWHCRGQGFEPPILHFLGAIFLPPSAIGVSFSQ